MPRLEPVHTATDIESQIAAVKADVAALTASLGQYAKAQKTHLANVASDGIDALHDRAVDQIDAAKHRGEKTYANAESLVKSHPAGSIALAAGVGFLVGLVATRR